MTKLNYEDLPPEAQEAIKKLTGYKPDEPRQASKTDWWRITDKSYKFIKHKQDPFWYVLLIVTSPIWLIGGIVWLIAFIATSC